MSSLICWEPGEPPSDRTDAFPAGDPLESLLDQRSGGLVYIKHPTRRAPGPLLRRGVAPEIAERGIGDWVVATGPDLTSSASHPLTQHPNFLFGHAAENGADEVAHLAS